MGTERRGCRMIRQRPVAVSPVAELSSSRGCGEASRLRPESLSREYGEGERPHVTISLDIMIWLIRGGRRGVGGVPSGACLAANLGENSPEPRTVTP